MDLSSSVAEKLAMYLQLQSLSVLKPRPSFLQSIFIHSGDVHHLLFSLHSIPKWTFLCSILLVTCLKTLFALRNSQAFLCDLLDIYFFGISFGHSDLNP